MSLTYGLKTARDMLEKLQREHERLKTSVSTDTLFNLVVTAYHIIDWVKKDPGVPSSAQADVNSMYQDTSVAICRDLANASKHFSLSSNYSGQITAKTTAPSGYGVGRFGHGAFGVGEESIVVVLNDGRRFQALALAQQVRDAWEAFFAKHGM